MTACWSPRLRFVLVLGVTALVGCAPGLETRVPGVRIAPARVAGMEAIIRAFELDFHGERTPKPEWVTGMTAPIDGEIERVLTGLGSDTFDADNLSAADGASDTYHAFRCWSEIAMMEIAAQKSGRADFHRASVSDWRYRDDLLGWSSALDADFVLTVLFRDTRETTGRVLGGAVGGMYTYFKQIGVACLVDLKDARMVACSAQVDHWRDLGDPADARRATYELLAELFGLAPPATQPMRDYGPWAVPRDGRSH